MKHRLHAAPVWLTFLLLLPLFNRAVAQSRINRQQLVERHNVVLDRADTLSSLTVGNGRFAFTIDVTGLQTFPVAYRNGVPLGTQSEWGWHSFIDTAGYTREEALMSYPVNGRQIPYLSQPAQPARSKAAGDWFRQNPHRLQLGNLGFDLRKRNGSPALLADIRDIKQVLNCWTGEITSRFTLEGVPVEVSTLCDPQSDVIAARVQSPLVGTHQLAIQLVFPYPTGEWSDVGTNYTNDKRHRSWLDHSNRTGGRIYHQLDTTRYAVDFRFRDAALTAATPHRFLIRPAAGTGTFTFSGRFSPAKTSTPIADFATIRARNQQQWKTFWTSGAAVDFSGSTDKRAFELERRIVLSQYLLRIQEAGANPPQETGLTYNSWFGKPHMEMPYWHLGSYPYWGHDTLLEHTMDWYFLAANKARSIAKRQGFAGMRWPKMTDNTGDETPSSVGAFLIWQQPHLIYFAESLYRNAPTAATLEKFKTLVFGTADFMASFAFHDQVKDRYILGPGIIPAQEVFKQEVTINPTYELVYWHWALTIAQQWRTRLQLPRNKQWDDVLTKLSKLPVGDGMYLATESAIDSYTNPRFRTDHPCVLMALGTLPATGQVDSAIMRKTFDWVWNNWNWEHTWGWDFPMVAMTATRLGMPEKAIDALLMPVQTNTYLANGHNYQNERLRLYLPGNGGLLSAVALMCAGYDGATVENPGIPKNGTWKVQWEGLKKLP